MNFNHYSARSNHSSESTELISLIKSNLREEVAALDESEKFQVVKRLNAGRIKAIIQMFDRGAFIKDDSLETYVNTVLHNILESNGMTPYQARVLVLDSHAINAYCFGQGIYIVTAGLLARINSEDELAFTIAHEVAHDVLGHIRKRLIHEAEVSLAKKTKEQIMKILTGTIELEDVQEYRSLIYGANRHNRINEIQADSMGISLMQNAAYDQEAADAMLTALDESLKTKFGLGPDLVWPLHSAEYPLQERWFDERLSIYSREYADSYLYSVDSLESHPDIGLRKERLQQYMRNDIGGAHHQPKEFAGAITLLAEFETLESAYEHKSFDRCLFYALQLLNRYPENPFLVSRIAKVLLTLYESRSNNDNTFQNLVPKYTAYYSEELTLLNNMLHNLSTKELGELAFHFLNSPGHFNPDERAHYYLLWRISEATYKRGTAYDIKQAYKERFHGNISAYRYR